MILLFNDVLHSQDHDSGKEKQDLSHSVSENTTLRKLVLCGSSDLKIAVLRGVAASTAIEDLSVRGKLAERTCLVTMATALLYFFHKLVTCLLPHL